MRTFLFFPFIWLFCLFRYILLAPRCPHLAASRLRQGALNTLRRRPPPAFLAALCGMALLLPGLARAQTDTTPTLVAPGHLSFNNSVRAFVQDGDKLWVGGWFSYVGSSLALRLARFNADGTRDTSITLPQPNDWVHVLVHSGGHIYVGGDFTHVNGMMRPYIFRFNAATGALDTSFQPLVGTTTNSFIGIKDLLVQPDGKVVIAGSFVGSGGSDSMPNYIARLNPDGTRDTSFTPPSLNNDIWTIAQQGDKLLVGGYFTNVNVNGTLRHRLIRLNADGTVDTTFSDPGFIGNGVLHLSVGDDGKINVGGAFNGPRKYIMRLAANGALDTSFQDPGIVGSYVADILPHPDGGWLIGGSFSSVGGQPRADLARLHADGALDASFGNLAVYRNYERDVSRLYPLANRRLAIGGHFSHVLGQPRSHAAILRLPGFTVTASVTGGNGTATPATQDVVPGQPATITLAPDAGHAVDIANITSTCGQGSLNASGTEYTVAAVNANCAVTFQFVQVFHSITATTDPATGEGGTVTCDPNPVPHGGDSTCTATAQPGYTFAGFSGDCMGPTCTLTNVTEPKRVIAEFSRLLYAVTASVTGGNGTATPATQDVVPGQPATITLAPDAGHAVDIANITSTCGQGSLNASGTEYTVAAVNANCAVTFQFVQVFHSITATTDPATGEGGTVTCDPNPVPHGGDSTCTATAQPGYTFAGFSGDCTGATCTLTNVSAPQRVTANFSAVSVHPVPTLTGWGLMLLGLGAAGLGAWRLRRAA